MKHPILISSKGKIFKEECIQLFLPLAPYQILTILLPEVML